MFPVTAEERRFAQCWREREFVCVLMVAKVENTMLMPGELGGDTRVPCPIP
jgi:hypothetical protein